MYKFADRFTLMIYKFSFLERITTMALVNSANRVDMNELQVAIKEQFNSIHQPAIILLASLGIAIMAALAIGFHRLSIIVKQSTYVNTIYRIYVLSFLNNNYT